MLGAEEGCWGLQGSRMQGVSVSSHCLLLCQHLQVTSPLVAEQSPGNVLLFSPLSLDLACRAGPECPVSATAPSAEALVGLIPLITGSSS